ncbi:MAG: hypothetical protein KIT46_04140 [Anaerolineales bacterium]|nr:hypothetical protein [Anaerolineales bacterium]MCW5855218.1 hypothetical protein [Anaerolineales bacterium]
MREFFKRYSDLLLVLALALLVWVLFLPGVAYGETVENAYRAWQIANGLGELLGTHSPASLFSELRAEFGGRILLVNGPLALLYFLFGVKDWTTFFFPFAMSLVNIILVYRITYFLVGRKAGFFASLIWAFQPSQAFFAGAHAAWPWLVTVLLAGLGWLALHKTQSLPPKLIPWFKGLAVAAIGLFLMFADGYIAVRSFLALPEWYLLLPASFLALLIRPATVEELLKNSRFWFAWVLGLLLISGLTRVDIFIYAQVLIPLLFLGPALLVAGYLSSVLIGDLLKRTVIVLLPFLAICAWLTGGLSRIAIPDYGNAEWLTTGQFAVVLLIGCGLTFLTLFVIAWQSHHKIVWLHLPLHVILVLGVIFSLLLVIQSQGRSYADASARWRLADQWLGLEGAEGIVVDSQRQRLLLGYASGFTKPITRLPGDFAETLPGSLVILPEEDVLRVQLPENWIRVQSFGRPETPRLIAFRVLEESLDCNALSGLAERLATPLAVVDCDQLTIGSNLMANMIQDKALPKDSSENAGGLLLSELLSYDGFLDSDSFLWVQQRDQQGEHFGLFQKYFFFYDGRTVEFQQELEPDSLYYLHVKLKTEHAISALYLRIRDEEYSYGWVYPEEWGTYGLLISTAGFEAVQEVSISPVLISNHAQVEISHFGLYKLKP